MKKRLFVVLLMGMFSIAFFNPIEISANELTKAEMYATKAAYYIKMAEQYHGRWPEMAISNSLIAANYLKLLELLRSGRIPDGAMNKIHNGVLPNGLAE